MKRFINLLTIYFIIVFVLNAQTIQEKFPGIIPHDANFKLASAMFVYDATDTTFKAYTPAEYVFACDIADAATKGDSVDFGILRCTYIDVPADVEGTTITFEVYSDSLGAWVKLKDNYGTLYSIPLDGTATRFTVEPYFWAGIRKVRPVFSAQTGNSKIYFGARIY